MEFFYYFLLADGKLDSMVQNKQTTQVVKLFLKAKKKTLTTKQTLRVKMVAKNKKNSFKRKSK